MYFTSCQISANSWGCFLRSVLIFLVIARITLSVAVADAVPGFFRCPSLNSDTIVFTAEGDLWKVAVSGGAALRLTSHAGEESMAALSMDGSKVAFSAYYEGTKETNEWGL